MSSPSDYLTGGPAYNLKGHLAYVRQLYATYPLSTVERCRRFTAETLGAIEQKRPLGILREPVRECIDAMYNAEGVYHYAPPDLENRNYLSQLQAQFSSKTYIDTAQITVIGFFIHLIDLLPEFGNSTLTVPLSQLTRDYANFVHSLPQYFSSFSSLQSQLMDNVFHISGIDPAKPNTRKFITPAEYDGDATDFLRRTPFAALFNTPVPFSISKKNLSQHGFIISKPGHGKTQLLGNFVKQFLDDPDKPGVFILDPAGDWFDVLRDRIDPARLVVLDPETNPPPLNFFDFKHSTDAEALQSFLYLMSSLSGGLSDKQTAIVPYLLKLLKKIPDASLETLRLVVDEKVKGATNSQFAPFIQMLPQVDQGFFHNQFYTSAMGITKEAISWKIYGAMASDAFREMFTAPTNSFDARAAMRERKVVLARGSENTLGEHGLPIFMQYLVSQFFLAALGRFRIPIEERHQCYLLCDEASHIFNHQTTRILVECRKLGLSFIGATQLIEQIPTEVKAAIYGATSFKFAGEVSHQDANVMGNEMKCSGSFIQSMKTYPPKEAEWAVYQSGMDKAIKVTVPMLAMEKMPKRIAVPVQVPPPLLDRRTSTVPPPLPRAAQAAADLAVVAKVTAAVRAHVAKPAIPTPTDDDPASKKPNARLRDK